MRRDFTYIDDVIEAVLRLVTQPAVPNPAWSGDEPDPASSNAPWRIFNIANSQLIEPIDLVRIIEQAVGRSAFREFLPMQAGDVVETCADCAALERAIGFKPSASIEDGVRSFVDWYRDFYKIRIGARRAFEFHDRNYQPVRFRKSSESRIWPTCRQSVVS